MKNSSLTLQRFQSIGTYFAVLIIATMLPTVIIGQKTGRNTLMTAALAAPTPVVFNSANIDCADLNASSDPRFAHIVSNNQLKLDSADPNGTFPFTNGPNREVVGPQDATKFVTINSGSATVFSWTSDIAIGAMILKVGNDSYVFPYNPQSTGDTNLATNSQQGLSHVSFCFGGGSTAASLSVTGRVTDINGRSISKARVSIMNAATGQSRSVITSAFGYYTIEDLEGGDLYVLMVYSKSHTFEEPVRTLSLLDSAVNVDFVGRRN